MTSTAAAPPALRPEDFLNVDRMLSDEERDIRDTVRAFVRDKVSKSIAGMDANDTIYQFDSSRNYNPWPDLEKITAPMTWINSADDFINPRNFPYSAVAVKRMKNAQFRLIPETADTHGHGTHTWAVNWKGDMSALLARSQE